MKKEINANMEVIGEHMKQCRIRVGLTQKNLSEKSGVDRFSISDYERGVHYPTMFNLLALADALGVSLDEYIGREVPSAK